MASNHLTGIGSESKQLATWYLSFAAIIFGAQLLFGLVAAIQYVMPGFLFEILDFSIARILHINSLVVWMVFAMIGSVYWLLPDETGIETIGIKIGKLLYWVFVAAIVVVVLVYIFVQVGPADETTIWFITEGREYIEAPRWADIGIVVVVLGFIGNLYATGMKGEQTGIVTVLMADMLAFAGIYLAGMFFTDNVTVDQFWWWWVIHLWVEATWEVFVGAIKEQYLPDGEDSELPSSPLSAIVAMSIKLDTLLALFSVNQIPTGSRDPFALRRAVNGLIRITKEHNLEFDIVETLALLGKEYKEIDMLKLEAFFLERVKQYFKVNPSIVEAVLASGERELLAMGKKIEALEAMVNSEGFSEAFSTFKRVANITKDIDMSSDMSIDEKLFEEEAERTLHVRYIEVTTHRYNSYEEELDALLGLKPELDKFFEDVMVNAEDESVKNNRKSLVASIYKNILNIADIKEVSI